MESRRRPEHHFRRTAKGVTEVNKGVSYGPGAPPQVASGLLRGTLLGAVQQISDQASRFPTEPISPHTGDVLLAETGNRYFLDVGPDSFFCLQERNVNPSTGVGTVAVNATARGHNIHPRRSHILDVGPGMVINEPWAGTNLDLRRTYTPDSFVGVDIFTSSFAEAHLDGTSFSPDNSSSYGTSMNINSVCFDGASLKNAHFKNCSMRNVSMADVDASGAKFELLIISYLDISGPNIRPDQIHLPGGQNAAPFLYYDRYSVDQVSEASGISKEDLGVMIWAGDVEVRDNDAQELVGGYDKTRHHIPQWEIQRLAKKSGGVT